MAKIEVPAVPEGFSSWEEYHNNAKEELQKFLSVHPENSLKYGTPEYEEYRQLDRNEWESKYRAEDEKKLAKKAALEAQAAEAGMGPKEMKVVNTLERYKKSIDKFIDVAGPKAVSKGVISQTCYEGCVAFANKNLEVMDLAWEAVKDETEYSYKKLKNAVQEIVGDENFIFSSYNEFVPITEFLGRDDDRKLWEVTPDIESAVRSYCSNLSKRFEARCMDIRNQNRVQRKTDKESNYQRIRSSFYQIKQGEIPTMQLFLDNWKKEYVEYFTSAENYRNYEAIYLKAKERKEAYYAEKSQDPKWRSWNDRVYEDLKDYATTTYIEFRAFQRSPEEIKKDADIEAEEMERKFIMAVYDYSGEIDSVELKWGLGGNLNGTAVGKDGRKWNIHTIIAEGPIQRRHLRTLVHEIR